MEKQIKQQKIKNKEYIPTRQMVTLENLIKNKVHIDFFTSLFQQKIEKTFIIDTFIRVFIIVPFIITPIILDKYNSLSTLLLITCSIFFIFSCIFAIQGHLVFNEKIFHGKKVSPFFKNLLSNYFMTQRSILFFSQKYKKLSKEQKLLLNSIHFPKTGCDLFSYNLIEKLRTSKPCVVFKNKDIIFSTIEKLTSSPHIQTQITTILESKLLQHQKELDNLEDFTCNLKIKELKEKYSNS